jgi:GNAT superfamily N-acetyltransferase
MIIRNLLKSDYPKFDAFMQQLHNLHAENRPDLYLPMEHVYEKEQFEKMLCDENLIMLGAEEENILVGICAATVKIIGMTSLCSAYLDELFVDEPFRHRGIARALIEATESKAKALGSKCLILNVWAFNQEAKNLYESLGMTPQRILYEKKL